MKTGQWKGHLVPNTDDQEAHTIIQEDYQFGEHETGYRGLATHRGQTYWESLLEAKTNIAIGFVISWVVWVFVVTPLWGFPFKLFDSLAITSIFTVTSLARQFVVRRWFNGRSRITDCKEFERRYGTANPEEMKALLEANERSKV